MHCAPTRPLILEFLQRLKSYQNTRLWRVMQLATVLHHLKVAALVAAPEGAAKRPQPPGQTTTANVAKLLRLEVVTSTMG